MDSSVIIVTTLQAGWSGNWGLVTGRDRYLFYFTASRLAVDQTQPPAQLVWHTLSMEESKAWRSPLTYSRCCGWECVELSPHPCICSHGTWLSTETILLIFYITECLRIIPLLDIQTISRLVSYSAVHWFHVWLTKVFSSYSYTVCNENKNSCCVGRFNFQNDGYRHHGAQVHFSCQMASMSGDFKQQHLHGSVPLRLYGPLNIHCV